MAKRPTKTSATNSLLTALEFLEPVMKEDGTPSQTHVVLNNKFAVAFDGTIAIGHPIDEELAICPNFYSLKAALKKSKDTVAITVNNNSLSVVSGRLKVLIPCTQYNQMMVTQPDNGSIAIDDRIKTGFDLIGSIVNEDDKRIVASSLCLSNQSMMTTDGTSFFEYWHGFNLPTMILPKRVVQIVGKTDNKLVGIGFTLDRSITFYFENGAWVKSQLRSESWPDVSFITNITLDNAQPIPEGLIEAIDSVLPHSTDKAIYFGENCVRSHHTDQGDTGARYEVSGLQSGAIYNGERLKLALKLAMTIQFDVRMRNVNNVCGFYGENIRGFVMPRSR